MKKSLFNAGLFWGFSLEIVGTASVKDTCFRGSWSGGGEAGSNHTVDRDLGEFKQVGGFSAWLPLNPSSTPFWSHAQVFPIQVGISTGVEPPSTWNKTEITCCAADTAWHIFIIPIFASHGDNTGTLHVHLLYLCSCRHSLNTDGCHCPCPWWRTSFLCGCSWGRPNLQTDVWGEW